MTIAAGPMSDTSRLRAVSPPSRVGFVVASASYTAALQFLYIALVAPIWSYAGYSFVQPNLEHWIGLTLLALIPAWWIPLQLERPSQWLYMYLYVAVYIPTCFVPLFTGHSIHVSPHAFAYLLTMLLGMIILGAIYRIPCTPLRRQEMSKLQYWLSISLLLLGAYGIMFAIFGRSLSLSALTMATEAVRDQRYNASEDIVSIPLVGYCLNLPAWAINPILMAYGLWRRRPLIFLLGASGQLLLFSVNAVRGVLATIPLFLGMYCLLKVRLRIPFGSLFMWCLAGGVFLSTLIGLAAPREVKIQISAAAIRPLISPAYTSGLYYEFFKFNPKTNFSHVKGISYIVEQPYPRASLGRVIGNSPRAAREQHQRRSVGGWICRLRIHWHGDCLRDCRDLSVLDGRGARQHRSQVLGARHCASGIEFGGCAHSDHADGRWLGSDCVTSLHRTLATRGFEPLDAATATG